MRVGELFESRFVTASDIEGKCPTVVIREVRLEKVRSGGKEEEKAVVYFNGATKGLPLNRTNALRIADFHGDETDHWIGRAIRLVVREEVYDGKTYRVVRVEAPPAPSGPIIAPTLPPAPPPPPPQPSLPQQPRPTEGGGQLF